MATILRHPGKFALALWAAFTAVLVTAAGAKLGPALFVLWLCLGGAAIAVSALFLIKLAMPERGMPLVIYQRRVAATVVGFVLLGGVALFLVFAFALYAAFRAFT